MFLVYVTPHTVKIIILFTDYVVHLIHCKIEICGFFTPIPMPTMIPLINIFASKIQALESAFFHGHFLVILYICRVKPWFWKAAIAWAYNSVRTKSLCLNVEQRVEQWVKNTDYLTKIKFLLVESKLLWVKNLEESTRCVIVGM